LSATGFLTRKYEKDKMKKTPLFTISFLALVITGTFLLGTGASAASFTVKAARASGDWVWQPRSKAIVRGDKIVWKNPTNATHDVTAYGSNWNKFAVLDPGDSTTKRFWQTGTYKYRWQAPLRKAARRKLFRDVWNRHRAASLLTRASAPSSNLGAGPLPSYNHAASSGGQSESWTRRA